MALHSSKSSLLRVSLLETISIVEYCLKNTKDSKYFGEGGYYGIPAAILLLSVVDALGAHMPGSKKNHFNVLNNKKLFGLNLSKSSVDILYKEYRCVLTHESTLNKGSILRMGTETDPPFEVSISRELSALNLLALLKYTKKAVSIFISEVL